MASRTSLTGVAVSDGYDQLLHVSDSDGLHATTLRQIYDGDGTASALFLAGETVEIVLGTDPGDDFIISEGTRDVVTVEGDLRAVTIRGDNSVGSDFIVEDSVGTDLFNVATDTQSVTVGLDGSAAADFLIETTAGTDIFLVESDTLQITATLDGGLAVIIGTDATDDFTVNDGTRNLLEVEGDNAATTIRLDATSGSDFLVEDSAGTDIFLVESDTKAITFKGDTTAGSDFIIENSAGTDIFMVETDSHAITIKGLSSSGSDFLIEDSAGTDLFLVETDSGNITIGNGTFDFDISSHDGTNGLLLGGVLVAAGAAEINNAADVSGRTQAITSSGAVTAGVQSVELDHTSTAIAATIANSNAHQGLFHVKATTEPAGGQDHTLTLTLGTFDGTNDIATFADVNDALLVYFDSAGEGTIVENVGTVGLTST